MSWLSFWFGYLAALLTLWGATWLGGLLKRAAEEQTAPVDEAPRPRDRLTHVGVDGALHRGFFATCTLCERLRQARTRARN